MNLRTILLTLTGIVLSHFSYSQTSDENYVTTHRARISGYTGSIAGVTDQTKVMRSTQYYDGLGRPMQQVIRKGSPNSKDLVTPIAYDTYGRQDKGYLMYENAHATPGNYHSSWSTEIASFYSSTTNKVADESTYYYSETKFEASPLNRPSKQYGAGDGWRSPDKFVAMNYSPNTPGTDTRHILQRFSVANNSNQTITHESAYSAGDLWVTETTDENGNISLEFRDKLGQTVAKKSQVSGNTYATTYYLYDVYGQLTFVLQPEGTVQMGTTYSLLNDTAFRKKWMFRYQYDGRRRMIEKQVPGAEPVYMVYDARDRLVLTQDGNQRVQLVNSNISLDKYSGQSYQLNGGTVTLTPGFHAGGSSTNTFSISTTAYNQYTFTKYDVLNRPIMTGICTITDDLVDIRADAQAMSGGETITTTGHGYSTSTTYPNESRSSITFDQVLSVTYYDDYRFKGQGYFGNHTHNYIDKGADFENTAMSAVSGQVTGNKVKVLGTDDYLYATSYYDDRYRMIQSISTNIHGGTDRVSNAYSFTGTVKKSIRNHDGEESVDTEETYTYDHMDRLITATHKIDQQGAVTMQSNSYNEIGELVEKNIGNAVQSIDYRYNIRGWLTTINGGTTLDDGNDRLGLELQYDLAGQFNGNIGKMKWKTAGLGNAYPKTYDFTYDLQNRLKTATYSQLGANNFFNVTGDDNGIRYDANGNIKDLIRTMAGQVADDLAYAYNGNQLVSVKDYGTSGLFTDGNTTNTDYKYDQNGNMISDANKAIGSITYNYLNLPERVSYTDGNGVQEVQYTYDASGVKLKKETTSGADIDYLGGIQYRDGLLDFIQHSEGRARKSGASFLYEYNLTDHLGNVRVTVDAGGNVIQRDDYYPFGLTFNSYTSGTENLYKYNGKEEQKETGWLDYGARMYQPDLGRWFNIDPLAEETYDLTPYHYVYNNPLLFIDPDGMFGDYFDEDGKHLGNDGKDDDKVYEVKGNTDLDQWGPDGPVVNESETTITEIGTRDDFVDMNGKEISSDETKNALVGLSINMKNNGITEDYAKITVTGGDRSETKNKSVSGAKKSRHIQGDAADIKVKGMSNKDLTKAAGNSGLFSASIYYPNMGDTQGFGRHSHTISIGVFNIRTSRRNIQKNAPHVHVDNRPGKPQKAIEYTGHNPKNPTFKILK